MQTTIPAVSGIFASLSSSYSELQARKIVLFASAIALSLIHLSLLPPWRVKLQHHNAVPMAVTVVRSVAIGTRIAGQITMRTSAAAVMMVSMKSDCVEALL